MYNREPNAICTICGTPYWRQPQRLAKSRFCSIACKALSRGSMSSKADLEDLYYNKKLSMQQIATHYECSLNKIIYWMDAYGFERRDYSEATYVYRNPDGDPFTIRLPETIEEEQLFALAVGLYWGEGSKKGVHRVAIANTDPAVLRVFMNFLEIFCSVDRIELHAQLNIFADCDVEGSTQWWAKELRLELSQFYQPTVREPRSDYSNKSDHGTLSIGFSNSKLLDIIKTWCKEYAAKFGK